VNCFHDLRRSPAAVLAALPGLNNAGGNGCAAAAAAGMRRLLESLAAGRPVRIDCGGQGHEDAEGRTWGGDSFYLGGKAPRPAAEEIEGTASDLLYQTERVFPAEGFHPPCYRLPLPDGRYRVTLHFAETFYRVKRRRFEVLVEGETVLPGHEPLARGFATAHAESFPVEVKDGDLEIELDRKVGDPGVAAIEVEPIR
jgi:beta-galactosidase